MPHHFNIAPSRERGFSALHLYFRPFKCLKDRIIDAKVNGNEHVRL